MPGVCPHNNLHYFRILVAEFRVLAVSQIEKAFIVVGGYFKCHVFLRLN
jgi:hypothetical protein